MFAQIIIAMVIAFYAPTPICVIICHALILQGKRTSRRGLLMLWMLLSVVSLAAIYVGQNTLFVQSFSHPGLIFAGIILVGIALIIEFFTRKELGSARIMGSSEFKKIRERLVTTGIYSLARHPRHVEHPLIFVGLSLIFGYISLVIFAIYLGIGLAIATYFEEKELVNRYGEEYVRYQKKTPAFFI